jgi:hypothetical protein
MMGWKKKHWPAWLATAVFAAGFLLVAGPGARAGGDGDGFPLACVNFGGKWKSDAGTLYGIEQTGCRWLQITEQPKDGSEVTTTIVPDNQAREIPDSPDCGTVLYKWNSLDNGTAIETHRKVYQADRTVTDLVTLEQVNEGLVLQSTYTTIEYRDGQPPQHDYKQEVFRRVPNDGGNGDSGDQPASLVRLRLK